MTRERVWWIVSTLALIAGFVLPCIGLSLLLTWAGVTAFWAHFGIGMVWGLAYGQFLVWLTYG